jgi:glycosyltransferase involved in cell wall biosynthesis
MEPAQTRTALTMILFCYAVEVLVVDGGSTDETFAVARAVAARDHRVRIIRSQPNHGKGSGVRTGVLEAEGELIVFTDADGSYGPGEVARVTAALADAPAAIGSRPVGWATGPPARRLTSLLFNRAIRVLLGLPFGDTQCGMKGFRRQAAGLQQVGRRRRSAVMIALIPTLALLGRLGWLTDPLVLALGYGRPLRAKAFRASMSGPGGEPGGQDRGWR